MCPQELLQAKGEPQCQTSLKRRRLNSAALREVLTQSTHCFLSYSNRSNLDLYFLYLTNKSVFAPKAVPVPRLGWGELPLEQQKPRCCQSPTSFSTGPGFSCWVTPALCAGSRWARVRILQLGCAGMAATCGLGSRRVGASALKLPF